MKAPHVIHVSSSPSQLPSYHAVKEKTNSARHATNVSIIHQNPSNDLWHSLERSQDLVIKALKAGFRAIDTAPQRKHYRQDLVGQGIREAIGSGIAKREDLYVRDSKLFSYLPSISIADYF